ncbi:MAG: hypothetical protein ACRCX4_00125 [Bacteroidales bacterium]
MIQEYSLKQIFNKSHLFKTTKDKAEIIEHDKNSKVKKLNIINQDNFLLIDTELIRDFSSFFKDEILKKDSDGIVLFELEKGKDKAKYIYIIELKSTYNSVEIYKAKNQIISTYIKLNILLNAIQPFNKTKYKFKGFIIALTPSLEKQTGMGKYLERKDVAFAYKLSINKSVNVKFDKTEANNIPINKSCCFDELNINFIGADSEEVELNTLDYL